MFNENCRLGKHSLEKLNTQSHTQKNTLDICVSIDNINVCLTKFIRETIYIKFKRYYYLNANDDSVESFRKL